MLVIALAQFDMNTNQLTAVLQTDSFCRNYTSYVGAKDECMDLSFDNIEMVIGNTDTSEKSGSHWFALFKPSADIIEYFNSYGAIGIDHDIKKRISSTFSKSVYSTQRMQGANTSVCGQYCLLYLLLRARGYLMKEINDMLLTCTNVEFKDHKVNQFINLNFSEVTQKSFKTHDFSFISPSEVSGIILCQL